jgi:hypothetical protein
MPLLPQDATGYSQTMLALAAEWLKIDLPVSSVQYDSWWYYKGKQGGITLWEPMPSTLGGPTVHGEPSSWLQLPREIPSVMHSRYFQPDNEYILGTAPDLPPDWKNWSWYVVHCIVATHEQGN